MAKGRRNKGVALNLVRFFKVKALLLFFFVTILFGSCVTQKACLQKFPIKETHDTLIVYRDTIIEVPVFSVDDTTMVWGTVFDTVYANSGTAHAVTYVKKDTVYLTVWQSDTTLRVKLDSAIRELQIKDTEIYTIRTECEKSKVERALTWVFYIVIGIGFIVLIRFFTKIVK